MLRQIKIISGFFMIVLLCTKCQDPIGVGTDLLNDQRIDVELMDTFSLSSQTVKGDSVATYIPNATLSTYLVGQMVDQTFGNTQSELFLKFQMQTSNKPIYDFVLGLRLDSLVLALQYDTLGTYGALTSTQEVEVVRLNESFDQNTTYYSDVDFQDFRTIGKTVVSINPKDSVSITDHITRQPLTLPPHLRVKIENGFALSLLQNELAAKNDTVFGDFFKGVRIKSKSLDNSPFLFGFNLSNTVNNADGQMNKLIMYYSEPSGDTLIRKQYTYNINRATINRFQHDYKNSQVENHLKNTNLGNTRTFLQPMGGVKTEISFDNLQSLKGKKIVKAELDVFVEFPIGKERYNTAPIQLLASHKLSNGSSALIRDISQLLNNNVEFATLFGGRLNTTNSVLKYTINITNHIKQSLIDPNFNSTIELGILSEELVPQRGILYGAKHQSFPMKLKVTVTK